MSAGAVERLVEVLSQHSALQPTEQCDLDFLADTVCTLGSLGYNTGPGGLTALLSSGGIECLVSTLQEGSNAKVVGAALRALKLICQVRPAHACIWWQRLLVLLQPCSMPGAHGASGGAKVLGGGGLTADENKVYIWGTLPSNQPCLLLHDVLLQSSPAAHLRLLQPEALLALVRLLCTADVASAEAAAVILARCCAGAPAAQLAELGAHEQAVESLVKLLGAPRRMAQVGKAEQGGGLGMGRVRVKVMQHT